MLPWTMQLVHPRPQSLVSAGLEGPRQWDLLQEETTEERSQMSEPQNHQNNRHHNRLIIDLHEALSAFE